MAVGSVSPDLSCRAITGPARTSAPGNQDWSRRIVSGLTGGVARFWCAASHRQVSPSMGLSKDAISSGPLGTSFNPQLQRGTSLDIRTYERPKGVGASNF